MVQTTPARIKPLDVGLDAITRWKASDDVHLPEAGTPAARFLPQPRALDRILRRPTLDQRVLGALIPANLDADLLDPAVLSETRGEVQAMLADRGRAALGRPGTVLREAALLLAEDLACDRDIRAALAALLKA